MNLQTRRILYTITILLFVVLAPTLFLYGIGYRYESASGSIVRTGGIYIRTYPNDSQVTIDQTKTITDNPARVRYLHPGTSQVSVTAKDHLPVNFSVDLKEAEVAVIDPLELLPIQASKILLIENVVDIFTSPFDDRSIISTSDSSGTYVTILSKNEPFQKIQIATENILTTKVFWGKKKALLQADENWYVVDLDKGLSVGPFAENISPSLNELDNTLTYSLQNTLYELNLETFESKKISYSGTSYFTHNQTSFLSLGTNGSTKLIALTDSARIEFGSLSEVPQYIPLNDKLLLLISGNSLSLINTQYLEKTTLTSDVGSWIFSSNKLYYTSGSEIWSYDTTNNSKRLVNRFTSKVTGIALSPRQSGILASFDDKNVFWYLTTPSPAIVTLPEQSLEVFQRIDSRLFRSFSIDANGLLTVSTYSI